MTLFSTDIGGDPDRPGDNAHCDVAVPCPVSELALLMEFFMVNFLFIFGELSADAGLRIFDSQVVPLDLFLDGTSCKYLEETSIPDFLKLREELVLVIAGELLFEAEYWSLTEIQNH